MNMTRTLILLNLFAFGFVPSLWAGGKASWTAKDDWYHAPQESGTTPWQWEKMPVYKVPGDKQDEAIERLKSSSFVLLSQHEAQDFARQSIEAPKGREFFLVRGVALNEGTGSFSIYSKGKTVWVYHGSLGNHPVAMRRRALIAALSEAPEKVFVTCSMDQ